MAVVYNSAEELCWFWLCNIPGIGNTKIRALLSAFGNADEIYRASAGLLESIKGIGEKEIKSIIESRKDNGIYERYLLMKKKDIGFIYPESTDYPQRLKLIYDAPVSLYYRGRLPSEELPSVAIIGARECSSYGKEVARFFGDEFAKMGIQVISGLARGIDSYGHLGANEGGGSTFGVLGCGVDICYPKENIELYMNILKDGGIISEYPPGTKPLAYQFPMRNRIISGLADVIVVIEAREKSGSLITVDQALEQNKDVMAVPGRIGDSLSEGCNNLIKMGAQIITVPEDILQNLTGYSGFMPVLKRMCDINTECEKSEKTYISDMGDSAKKNNMLASMEKKVYSCVDLFPKNLSYIIEETGLEANLVTEILLNLELGNFIREVSKNNYIRVFSPKHQRGDL